MNDNTLQCPAIDSAYVDAYTTDAVWLAATQEQKDSAILDSCRYFRSNYVCPWLDYREPLPTELKDGMAELAVLDINGRLYSNTNKERLKSKSLKAGSASISKTFSPAFSQKDPVFAKVEDIVAPYCYYSGGTVTSLKRA